MPERIASHTNDAVYTDNPTTPSQKLLIVMLLENFSPNVEYSAK